MSASYIIMFVKEGNKDFKEFQDAYKPCIVD